ncbi:MAG: Fpg/Nei family DNA glycosylase [bacterium]|nr:Fpg/Nei family DNA glycosylase [bacterium]
MPELPDVTVYVEALERRVLGEPLRGVRLASPFLLRSVEPPLGATSGKSVIGVRRVGKRIVLGLEDNLFLVLHLMIAGRLRWRPPDTKLNRKLGLAAFDFPAGTLVLTEASTRKRAGLWCVHGAEAVAAFDAGGVEPLDADVATFAAALRRERHTLKRTLTDPRLFAGIGNAYSDEILHRARLSPVTLSDRLGDDEVARLHAATQTVLREFTARIRAEVGDGFPEKVTAFRDDMAVHGRYRQPCPVCGTPVQRIVHAENETNYCPTCQTGGRLLADRSLSRLLKQDWPRSLDELEERRRGG